MSDFDASYLLFAFVGTVVAAVGIWLTVRIITRRERWAIWTAALMIEGLGLAGSAYCMLFYAWLSATPLSPASRSTVELSAYASMFAFAAFACGAVAMLVVSIRGRSPQP